MKSIIFLTTKTSATGSMYRSIRAILPNTYKSIHQAQILGLGNAADKEKIDNWVPPTEDHVIYFNAILRLNLNANLKNYNFILNARDPRDLLCNMYSWIFVHPSPGESSEQIAKKHEAAREMGIDRWVLGRSLVSEYDRLEQLTLTLTPESWTFIGYALYCLYFDDATQKISTIADVDLARLPPDRRSRLKAERTENLSSNRAWVGQRWEGSDIMPGRHKQELMPETIEVLTHRYANALAFLRSVDDPRLAHLYF